MQLPMIEPEQALKGRAMRMIVKSQHAVLKHASVEPLPDNAEQILLGMGCFWGAERLFWQLSGVHSTAVGYSAGYTPNPSYQEVCSGQTGHNEVVLVQYYPQQLSFQALLTVFWQGHNPTQGMRQGNDVGTQYRSGIYAFDEKQKQIAEQSRQHYQKMIADIGNITTEIAIAGDFYYAEDYHQQYLHKKPNGYCGLGGLGIAYD